MQLGGSDDRSVLGSDEYRLLDLPIQDSRGVAQGVRESAVCIVRRDDVLRIRPAAIADRPRSGYEPSLTRPLERAVARLGSLGDVGNVRLVSDFAVVLVLVPGRDFAVVTKNTLAGCCLRGWSSAIDVFGGGLPGCLLRSRRRARRRAFQPRRQHHRLRQRDVARDNHAVAARPRR
jgi:hypothetical protein